MFLRTSLERNKGILDSWMDEQMDGLMDGARTDTDEKNKIMITLPMEVRYGAPAVPESDSEKTC